MKEIEAIKTINSVKNTYNIIGKAFSQRRQYNWDDFKYILPHLKDNQNILDLGCGNGRLSKFLKENKKINYLGIDISSELLKQAKKENPNEKFIEGSMLNIPTKDDKFDMVILIASFHHIPTNRLRIKALKEIKRVLKKDGILIITVWNLFQKKYIKYIKKAFIQKLIHPFKNETRGTLIPWGNEKIPRYYYAFKNKELKKLLEKKIFNILENKETKNFIFICQNT